MVDPRIERARALIADTSSCADYDERREQLLLDDEPTGSTSFFEVEPAPREIVFKDFRGQQPTRDNGQWDDWNRWVQSHIAASIEPLLEVLGEQFAELRQKMREEVKTEIALEKYKLTVQINSLREEVKALKGERDAGS